MPQAMATDPPAAKRRIACAVRPGAVLRSAHALTAYGRPTMPRDASPLELTYESFEQFWKALVSKRKARRLDVDVASAWRQLSEGGAGAAFLRLHAESKAAKAERKHAAATGEPDAPQPVGTRKDPNSARPAAVTKRAAGRTPGDTERRPRRKATGR